MKNLLMVIPMVSLMTVSACAGAQAKSHAAKFKPYAMDNKYFTCVIPADWTLQRDKDQDEEYKIFEIQLISPKASKDTVSIKVSFFAKDNEDFNGYEDFISRNSKNALGETKSARENYAPVKKMALNGRKGFELSSETMEYLHPESKSDESVRMKEKIYVLPAKSGFYVIRFSAPKEDYAATLGVFEKVARSFKGMP